MRHRAQNNGAWINVTPYALNLKCMQHRPKLYYISQIQVQNIYLQKGLVVNRKLQNIPDSVKNQRKKRWIKNSCSTDGS